MSNRVVGSEGVLEFVETGPFTTSQLFWKPVTDHLRISSVKQLTFENMVPYFDKLQLVNASTDRTKKWLIYYVRARELIIHVSEKLHCSFLEAAKVLDRDRVIEDISKLSTLKLNEIKGIYDDDGNASSASSV